MFTVFSNIAYALVPVIAGLPFVYWPPFVLLSTASGVYHFLEHRRLNRKFVSERTFQMTRAFDKFFAAFVPVFLFFSLVLKGPILASYFISIGAAVWAMDREYGAIVGGAYVYMVASSLLFVKIAENDIYGALSAGALFVLLFGVALVAMYAEEAKKDGNIKSYEILHGVWHLTGAGLLLSFVFVA